MVLSATILAVGAFVGANLAYHTITMAQVNNTNAQVVKPPATVSIIVCCWAEDSDIMVQCLQSIKSNNIYQQYPQDFELIVIGCQNVDMAIAKQYADKTDCVQGKLSGRNRGVQMASGDIIVSLDCDAVIGPNFLNMLLQPFKDPNVVAVGTSSVQDTAPMMSALFRIASDIQSSEKLLGRSSAFRKSAFEAIGGFDDNFDQNDITELWHREEFFFPQSLSQHGKIVFLPIASVHLSGYGEGRGLRA